jgi:actin related protein 2/3 complex subunit 2
MHLYRLSKVNDGVWAESRDAFVNSVAHLKRNALSAPFERAFKEQKTLETSGGQGELMQIHYRDEEAIYVQASPDRVTVIFSTVFREETDQVFGKLFLQVCDHIQSWCLSLTYD